MPPFCVSCLPHAHAAPPAYPALTTSLPPSPRTIDAYPADWYGSWELQAVLSILDPVWRIHRLPVVATSFPDWLPEHPRLVLSTADGSLGVTDAWGEEAQPKPGLSFYGLVSVEGTPEMNLMHSLLKSQGTAATRVQLSSWLQQYPKGESAVPPRVVALGAGQG